MSSVKKYKIVRKTFKHDSSASGSALSGSPAADESRGAFAADTEIERSDSSPFTTDSADVRSSSVFSGKDFGDYDDNGRIKKKESRGFLSGLRSLFLGTPEDYTEEDEEDKIRISLTRDFPVIREKKDTEENADKQEEPAARILSGTYEPANKRSGENSSESETPNAASPSENHAKADSRDLSSDENDDLEFFDTIKTKKLADTKEYDREKFHAYMNSRKKPSVDPEEEEDDIYFASARNVGKSGAPEDAKDPGTVKSDDVPEIISDDSELIASAAKADPEEGGDTAKESHEFDVDGILSAILKENAELRKARENEPAEESADEKRMYTASDEKDASQPPHEETGSHDVPADDPGRISRAKGQSFDAYIGSDHGVKKASDAVGGKVRDIYGGSPSSSQDNSSAADQSEASTEKREAGERYTSETDRNLQAIFGTLSDDEGKKKKKNKNKIKKTKNTDDADEYDMEVSKSADIDEDADENGETASSGKKKRAASGKLFKEKTDTEVFPDEDAADDDADDEDEASEEYESAEDAASVSALIKKNTKRFFLNFLISVVLSGLIIYIESASFSSIPHPLFLTPGKFGLVFLLVDLQILLIAAVVNLRNVIDGAKSLFTGKANMNSVMFASILIAALHVIVNIIAAPTSESVMLFSSVAVITAAVNAFCSFINEKRIYRAFRIVSNKKKKYVARRLDKDSEEAKSFSEYLPENPDIFTVEKADFAEDFVKKTRAYAPSDAVFRISIPLCFICGFVLAVVSFISDGSFVHAVDVLALMFLMSMPVSSALVVSLPFFHFSKKADKMEAAILGEKSVDEYCNTAAVSFSDSEVFPPKGVKLTHIKIYGQTKLDKILLYLAEVFVKVGGPLSVTFENYIAENGELLSSDIEILEIAKNGICARIEGKEVFVGGKDYMSDYDFTCPSDNVDATFEKSVGRIMYVAIGNEVSAKFYIKYTLSSSFENLLRQLAQVGICAAIKTCDPNLDDIFLSVLLKQKKYPVVILNSKEAARTNASPARAKSGIVCTSTTANMLKTFILADKIKQRSSMNSLVKFISILLGVVTTIFLYATGCADRVTTFYVLIYHLIWSLPIVIPSIIN